MGPALLVCDNDHGRELPGARQRRHAQEVLRFHSKPSAVHAGLRDREPVQRAAGPVPGYAVFRLARIVLALGAFHPQ